MSEEAAGYQRRARQWELLLKRARRTKDPDEREALLLAVLVLARDVVMAIRQHVEHNGGPTAAKCKELLDKNRKVLLFLKYARNLYVHASPSAETPMTQHVSVVVNVGDLTHPLEMEALFKKGEVKSTREYVGFAWDGLSDLDRQPTPEETDRLDSFLFNCGYDLLLAVQVTAEFASELVEAWTS